MKSFTLTNRKIEELILGLQALSKPHPQKTTDGKTITRDFEIFPKAKIMLLRNMSTLKKAFEEREASRILLVGTLLPNGEENHTSQERAVFQKAYFELLNETKELSLHQVWLYSEATTKPDAIDLTKAEIPFDRMVDLLDIILIEPETGNSESKAA